MTMKPVVDPATRGLFVSYLIGAIVEVIVLVGLSTMAEGGRISGVGSALLIYPGIAIFVASSLGAWAGIFIEQRFGRKLNRWAGSFLSVGLSSIVVFLIVYATGLLNPVAAMFAIIVTIPQALVALIVIVAINLRHSNGSSSSRLLGPHR